MPATPPQLERGASALGLLAAIGLAAVLALSGCARPKVRIPPRVDLRAWTAIGLLQVETQGTGALGRLPTDRLLQTIQAAQPGVALLELGSEREVLATVGHRELDFEAVRAIGQHYGVSAVLSCRLELGDATPRLRMSEGLSSLRADARVDGRFQARLLAADSGATVWSAGSTGSRTLAELRASKRRPIWFDSRNLEDPYSPLVGALLHEATHDLRPTWERR